MGSFRLVAAHGLDKGMRRQRNEDSLGYHQPNRLDDYNHYGALFIVADGVGSTPQGILASDAAVRHLIKIYYDAPSVSNNLLHKAIDDVNQWVHHNHQGSATTLVAALIRGTEVEIAHVGDSRAYLYAQGQIRQLTQDHVQAVEQADGRIKYKLLQAIGYKDSVNVEVQRFSLEVGNRLILMTDGAIRYITNEKLKSFCAAHSNPHTLVQDIINFSNASGGIDNIGVIVIDVGTPLRDDADLGAHLDAMKKQPEGESADSDETPPPKAVEAHEAIAQSPDIPEPQEKRGRLPLLLGSILILVMIIVGGYFWNTQNLSPQNTGVEATHIQDTEIVEEDVSTPASSETVTTETPELSLSEGLSIVFEGSESTFVQINGDVVAFVIEIERVYEISDMYEDDDLSWYRLYDERNDSYGWIAETTLPTYRLNP